MTTPLRITRLRLWQVSGPAPFDETFWDERLVRPVDVYPEHRVEGVEIYGGPAIGRATSIFVELETDQGACGIGGPISMDEAFHIDRNLRPLVEGADALAHERLWDRMYRFEVHGRKGLAMMAISAIDHAMWDLKGRVANLPVHRLLGGPTRPQIRAYASALGFSLEPDRVATVSRDLVAQGFTAMKWFYRSGPADGLPGMDANEQLVATARDAVGPDVDIMTDAWMSWNVPYTLAMARRLEQYHPRWIEEPVLPDQVAAYAEIRAASPIPISGGEHEYTRWGIHRLLEAGAVDVLQPDVSWAGGITEMLKICALASTYGIPVVPHGHSVPATIHLLAAQPEPLTPLLEYLVKWNEVHQFFLRTQIRPVNGMVDVPEEPGLGMTLDESKIETRRELHWSDR
jgi:L-alanine-DL-glutamate epimerase-like enolase superfamily enzyme